MSKSLPQNGLAHNGLDPISVEILFNSLRSITDETYIALMKSAYSTNIKERHDHSTAITDVRGRLIVQAAESLPIHVASMSGLMRSVLDKYTLEEIQPGDIYVANDPHVAGGTHLPDVNLAMPMFVDGKLVGFMCNIAHHADVGGMAPGSMAGGMTEIYQEGLRIPVIRLFSQGVLQDDVFELLLLNVRVPHERRGDYHAQIAACKLGERRFQEVVERHGVELIEQVFEELIDRTHQRVLTAIAEIPPGEYRFSDVMDGDGVNTWDIPIAVKITVSAGKIVFDFAGTSSQVPGNINVTLNATQAAVCYSIKALLDPDLPSNQGLLDAIEIRADKGLLVNAVYPASVASRAHTCQRIIDVCFGALAQALPDRVPAAGNGANTTAVFSGVNATTGEPWLYLETLGGGMGARPQGPGKDGVQVGITNTSNLPVEAIESEYPLMVEAYSLVEGSGGDGRYVGGRGIRRIIRPLQSSCNFNGVGERFKNAPWGLAGGASGNTGQFVLSHADGKKERLPDKTQALPINVDQRLIIETPGAGGHGSS